MRQAGLLRDALAGRERISHRLRLAELYVVDKEAQVATIDLQIIPVLLRQLDVLPVERLAFLWRGEVHQSRDREAQGDA